MNDEPLLKPETYNVLKRIPLDWFHLQSAKELICQATDYPIVSVTRRMSALSRMKLVAFRDGPDGKEIRRMW